MSQEEAELAALRELARLYGVQLAYHDVSGRLVEAAPESLLAVVAALAGPFDGMGEVAEALAARRAELDTRLIEPVLVAWDGQLAEVVLRLPAGGAGDVGRDVGRGGGDGAGDVALVGDGGLGMGGGSGAEVGGSCGPGVGGGAGVGAESGSGLGAGGSAGVEGGGGVGGAGVGVGMGGVGGAGVGGAGDAGSGAPGREHGVAGRGAPGASHGAGNRLVACHLDLESGERRAWTHDLERLPAAAPGARRLAFPEALPLGYHRLEVKTGGRTARALVIAAPRRTYAAGSGAPLWGVFLPLYALRTARSWGAGDLTDLEALADWTAELGGGVVGTLPMLASFLDEPFEPSPYAPVSRLFWNEVYLDPRRLPEATHCPAARRLLESPELLAETRTLAALPLVDYRRLATLKRRVIEEMVAWFFANAGPRRQELERFVAARPEVADYAAFRAVGDRRGESWQSWPERLREGNLAAADYDEEDFRYHLWVQWAAEGQMQAAAEQARRHGPGLYLDLPVGVHGSGYDVWRERDVFAQGLAAGAPPDAFFTQGQNWGFPPLRPERLRERGYDYLIASLRHHLRHAGVLRIDHVMQLHRLFCIPAGMPAAAGVYVRYPAEELYAVLALESHRHRAAIVGENLGTVPPEVNEAMERHGVLGMYVMQYELAPGGGGLLREPPAASVAALNTHDMPTFRGFWEGRDVEDLRRLGFFDDGQAKAELERRGVQKQEMVTAVAARHPGEWDGRSDPYPLVLRDRLEHLATSAARLVLLNLEDLWYETEPQNVPGTSTERPNWRRKARLSFEEMSRRPEVAATLRRIDELRRKGGA